MAALLRIPLRYVGGSHSATQEWPSTLPSTARCLDRAAGLGPLSQSAVRRGGRRLFRTRASLQTQGWRGTLLRRRQVVRRFAPLDAGGSGVGPAAAASEPRKSGRHSPQPPSSHKTSSASDHDCSASALELTLQGSFTEQEEWERQADEMQDSTEEPPGFRSMWDLKVPGLDVRRQTSKMIQVLAGTSCAAMLSNMNKVNMSVAIVPMMAEFGWTKTVAGILQASFFWGYLVAQIPSGYLVSKYGGRVVLATGVFFWSIATFMAPASAYVSIALLCFMRFLVGFFEATAPSANADLITRWAATEERSRAVTAVWAGFTMGNIMGLLAAPLCASLFGWQSIFYIFGGLGVLWSVMWYLVNRRLPLPSKLPASRYRYVATNGSKNGSKNRNSQAREDSGIETKEEEVGEEETPPKRKRARIPYKYFFRLPAFWAMNIVHFGENWGKFTLMAWMPVYYRSTLGLSLETCSMLSILPYILGLCVSTAGATVADSLIKRGWDLTLVRKVMQCLASGGAGACMVSLIFATSPVSQVACLTGTLAMSNLSTVGLYCSHQDISPKYAGVMLSITNTAGSIPGMLGNILVGTLMDVTHSWTMSLMIPCAVCYLGGALAWLLLYSSEPVDFDAKRDNAKAAKLALSG